MVRPTSNRIKARLRMEKLEDRSLPSTTPSAVIRWNNLALDANARDHSIGEPHIQGGPTKTARAFAIVHTAIFDAVNSIDRGYQPYMVQVSAAPGASISAAIAAAGHDALVSLYPAYTS